MFLLLRCGKGLVPFHKLRVICRQSKVYQISEKVLILNWKDGRSAQIALCRKCNLSRLLLSCINMHWWDIYSYCKLSLIFVYALRASTSHFYLLYDELRFSIFSNHMNAHNVIQMMWHHTIWGPCISINIVYSFFSNALS